MRSTRSDRRRSWLLFGGQLLTPVVILVPVILVSSGALVDTVLAISLILSLPVVVLLEWFKVRPRPEEEVPVPGDQARLVRELRESRLEIVTAFEIERRRIERDLHDGAQQYLVAAAMKLGEVELMLDPVPERRLSPPEVADAVAALVGDASRDVSDGLAALRATVAGVHSRLLSEEGLEPAVRELAARLGGGGSRIVVRVPHPLPAMPEPVATAAWFFTAEALTNAVKHAPTASISVLLAADERLHVSVVDDGPGGAAVVAGHGLSGMRERLGAFGGTLTVSSPVGGPTSVAASIPLLLSPGQWGTRWQTGPNLPPAPFRETT